MKRILDVVRMANALGRVALPTRKHGHASYEECTETCPAFNPEGWRCSKCTRQRPMAADTEDLPAPLCDECFWEGAP